VDGARVRRAHDGGVELGRRGRCVGAARLEHDVRLGDEAGKAVAPAGRGRVEPDLALVAVQEPRLGVEAVRPAGG